jgi:hypothetical protein
MEREKWGILADQRLAEGVTASPAETVGAARDRSAGRWVVVVEGATGVMATASPVILGRMTAERTLSSVLADLPPVIIAAEETPIGFLAKSWMASQLEDGSAVVVTGRGGIPRGVWAGPDMLTAVAFASRRSLFDPQLPGDIQIPLLTRVCRFPGCGAVERFAEPPEEPPACPNPAGLTEHPFGW